MFKKIIEPCFVIIISILAGLSANLTYLLYASNTPKHTVNLGVTHYWDDYMFYIAQFFQGAHGSLVDRYPFTEEYLAPTINRWSNMLFGAIGSLFGLRPTDSYNISVILLVIVICLCVYILFKKLCSPASLALPAFIFFIFSTSLINKLPTGPVQYFPFVLWATPHLLFTRFGAAPHYLMQTVLFCVLLFMLFAKKPTLPKSMRRCIAVLSICLLTILHPVMSIIVIGSYWVTVVFWKQDGDKLTTLGMTVTGLLSALFMYKTLSIPPYTYATGWESQQQVTTTLLFLLASIGPVVPFALTGILSTVRSFKPIERFGAFLIIACYATFLSPLPKLVGISNIRFLFPGLYIFIAWFAAVGVTIAASYGTKLLHIKKQWIETLLIVVFLLASAPTVMWELQQKIPKPEIYADVLYFMPVSTYNAFTVLAKTGKASDVVLGNPGSHIGMLIPALSGHKTVFSTELATLDAAAKRTEILGIYTQRIPPDEARQWFRAHHVAYMVCTINCGDCGAIEKTYPFISVIFKTETARIYSVQKD